MTLSTVYNIYDYWANDTKIEDESFFPLVFSVTNPLYLDIPVLII